MKTRTVVVIALSVCLIAGVPLMASTSHAAASLRVDEPLAAVVADLEAFVPAYMEQEGVPGVAIALVRDGRVAWTEEFGVTNLLTGTPVTPDSTFKVASNSKVVTAYIALRLVDQGLLALDGPLDNYVSDPYLAQEKYRAVVTLRHTLSHTSGMGHDGFSRDVRFPPGAGYSYSANGFLYTQQVLEEVTGKSLEELAQEMVFQPLGMEHSSFVNIPAVMNQPAQGHLPTLLPALVFVLPFLMVLPVLVLLALIVTRLRSGQWRISTRAALTIYLLAALPPLRAGLCADPGFIHRLCSSDPHPLGHTASGDPARRFHLEAPIPGAGWAPKGPAGHVGAGGGFGLGRCGPYRG